MTIIEQVEHLPDDIILYIYTRCLKRYRMHEGQLVKRIDMSKYKFLEKYVHRVPNAFHMLSSDTDGEVRYRILYQLSNLIDIDRDESGIDPDMMYIEFTTTNSGSLRHNVSRYRLKKLEDFTIKPTRFPTMYYTGNSRYYDWETIRYEYEI